jgi:Tfp pilus assembly protein PilV
MIHTFFSRRWPAPIRLLRRIHATPRLGAEEGFTLIEVIVSALLVAFIAIATFNGFDVVNRTTADQRHHDQAVVLAAQSQEALRSDSASTLDSLQSASHAYTQIVGNEKYTITQGDRWVSDANQNASCSATGKESTSSQTGNYLQINTSVSWPQQVAAKRPPVTQYSIITPPDGSGLEVDVTNGRTPLQPVAGVTAVAAEAESTTSEAGCVIFGAIPATRVSVEAYKLGDVTPTGAIKKASPEVLVAPNVTTHYPVTLNRGAAITAEFTYKGATEFPEKTPVTGDTFVVFNPSMNLAPNFEVGSTQFGAFGKAGEYEALTGTAGSSYHTTATTPISATYYSTGDLFPFESNWTAYAGDCPENDAAIVDKAEIGSGSSDGSIAVEPGQNATVKVSTSYVTLNVYKGTKGVPGLVESESRSVKIKNVGCEASATPNNATHLNTAHTQNTTATGHLEAPFQPFGKSFEMCLYNSKTKYIYKTKYANEKVAGSTINLYMTETTSFEEKESHKVTVEKVASNTC